MLPLTASQGLTIPWTEIDFVIYNTIMGIAAGAGLLVIVDLGRRMRRGDTVPLEGYSLAFAINGFICTVTGLHMTLTWPLAAGGFPYSNILFGEPVLALGVILLGAAWILWVRRDLLGVPSPERDRAIGWFAGPTSVLGIGIGLGCFATAAAGIRYELFVAPPAEPITGSYFGQWPWIEITFVSGLYILTGIGTILLPLALRNLRSVWALIVGGAWAIVGAAWLVFGAFNFFAHTGLIINTTPTGG